MKAQREPVHYPEHSPNGPWGVDSIGRVWYVIHRHSLRAKAVGKIVAPKSNYFDRAMEIAHQRNREE